MSSENRAIPLAPTVEAIDSWRAQEKHGPDGSHRYWLDGPAYGVDIRTKASEWRCITSAVEHQGERHYWTIKGEGSSNGCREYAIPASKITQARGWKI